MKKQMLAVILISSLLLSGCNQTGEISSSPDLPEASRSSAMDNVSEEIPDEEEPAKAELIELFDNAMYEINYLAAEDPTLVIIQIFHHEIEIDYSDMMTIDSFPYVRTSRRYSELEDHYAQFFTGETLDWIMSTKFADIDGTLYCCITGGATGFGSKTVSIERLEGNTYQATYQNSYIDGFTDKNSTTFSIQKTDAGYRISSIDYCPNLLNREWLKEH